MGVLKVNNRILKNGTYNIIKNITKTKSIYGYLYNGYSILDSNFAPVDWSVPTKSDYDALINYIDISSDEFGSSTAGGPLKSTGTTYWNSPNAGATNSTGFSMYGSGQRSGVSGNFGQLNVIAFTATKTKTIDELQLYGYNLYSDYAWIYSFAADERQGYSVRLIWKGSGTPNSIMFDYDGNEYDVVEINGQYWIKQNWKCTHLNNGTSLTKVTNNTTWSTALPGDLYYCAYDNNDGYV